MVSHRAVMYGGIPETSTDERGGNTVPRPGYPGLTARRALALASVVLVAGMWGTTDIAAQTVSGTVTAAGEPGQPVAGALVILLDIRGAEVARTQSNESGRYLLAGPAGGQYRLRFLVPGYRPLVSPFLDLVAGPPTDYPLQLTAVPPAMLDTVIVEGRAVTAHMAPFYRRREFGRGRFLTRDEIDRTGAPDLSGLVRRLNMFDVLADVGEGTGPRIGQRGRGAGAAAFCAAAIFLNGTYVGMSGQVDVNMLLPVDGTEAVEAYRPGEVPMELEVALAPAGIRSGRRAGCGAVSLWSRTSAPDTTRIMRHLALSTHAGARLGGGGVRDGRFGFAFSYTLKGGIEFYPAVNVYRHVPNTALNPIQSGVQVVLALRTHAPSRDSPWYIGTGIAVVEVQGQPGANFRDVGETEGQHLVVLTGFRIGDALWRPYGELHVLNPVHLTSAQISLFVGLARRIF